MTETLKLLPPLVQARDVKEFLVESLRVPRFDMRVIREIARARRDDVATRSIVLEERRVKDVSCQFSSPLSFLRKLFVLLARRSTDVHSCLTTAAHNVTNESGTIASSRFTLLGWCPYCSPQRHTWPDDAQMY